MIGLNEIKKVQSKGSWANNEVEKASTLVFEVISFLCCNKFMRLLRFLFRKKFDEQYDKLSKATDWLLAAQESLDDQWELLEEYWDQTCEEELEEELEEV